MVDCIMLKTMSVRLPGGYVVASSAVILKPPAVIVKVSPSSPPTAFAKARDGWFVYVTTVPVRSGALTMVVAEVPGGPGSVETSP